MFGCGFHLNFKELLYSEGLVNVCSFINKTSEILNKKFKYIIYDNGCKMSKHINGNKNDYPFLADTICLIDRFHIKNHKPECFKHYNTKDIETLAKINSQVCEQSNFKLNIHKHATKHMTEAGYHFFFINLWQFKNTNKYDI